MTGFLSIALTIICSVIVAKLILKKYNAIFVFFASGIVILMGASLWTGTPILGKTTLGNVFLDTFGFISNSFKTNLANIGMIIMIVTGYAAYMKHIQASTKLAYLASKPLSKIQNKYLVLMVALYVLPYIYYVSVSHGLGHKAEYLQLRRFLPCAILAVLPVALANISLTSPLFLTSFITGLAWITIYPLFYYLTYYKTLPYY